LISSFDSISTSWADSPRISRCSGSVVAMAIGVTPFVVLSAAFVFLPYWKLTGLI